MRTSFAVAWRQLSHSRAKMLIAAAGVAVAVLLMMMQLGFMNAAYDSALSIPKQMQADLVVMNTLTPSIGKPTPFSRRLLYRMQAHPDVAAVQGIYQGAGKWRNPWTHEDCTMMIYGLEPNADLFHVPGYAENKERLHLSDTILFDSRSRPIFGPVVDKFRQGEIVEAEVNSRRIRVVGLTESGSSFAVDGTGFTSEANFLRLVPSRPPGFIDVGLVQLKPGADPKRVREELQQTLGQDVRILTGPEFLAFEVKFINSKSPIQFIFGLGTAVGFFIGFVIVYQILYTDVANQLPKFATMKAIGFGDFYLMKVVFEQAIFIALLGFLPGLVGSWGLYTFAAKVTRLPLGLEPKLVSGVFALTVVMCAISGAAATRKLRSADPADVF
ncbi:MAG TPA: ABC transporter permease DevC [Gemmataceae bacterium]|jgi:putative ABC transport system permease protein|nr:ABC transporter permease DevC [Gemmataceae bacterium]